MNTTPQNKGFTQDDYLRNANSWKENGYDKTLRVNYPKLCDNSLIIDLGGYQGAWAQKMFCKYNCNVDIYEPIHEYYSIIMRLFEMNPKVGVHRSAVWTSTGAERISKLADASTFYKWDDNGEVIATTDVLELFAENKKIDLLKINIEGAEYDILDRILDHDKQNMIGDIQVQFHLNVKNYEARRESIQNRLRKTHRLTYCTDFVWENWTKI